MPSNIIYESKKIVPYVYVGLDKVSGKFYIGSRTSKTRIKTPPSKDLFTYQTSSKIVKDYGFHKLEWIIVAEFFGEWDSASDAAIKLEQDMIREWWGHPDLLNGNVGGYINFSRVNSGTVTVKIENGKLRRVSVDHPKRIDGTFEVMGSGTINLYSQEEGRYLKIDVNDARRGDLLHNFQRKCRIKRGSEEITIDRVDLERYIALGWSHVMKGNTVVKDREGNNFLVSLDDPRYISGELAHVSKGTSNAILVETGELIKVPVDDPRFSSGEIVGQFKDTVMAKGEDGRGFRLSKSDERYKTGSFVSLFEDTVMVKNKKGERFRVDKNDTRLVTGELVGHTKGQVTVINCYGEKVRVSTDDPRLKSGELVGNKKMKVTLNTSEGLIVVYPNDHRLK
jgi:hypothetical protein